MSGDSVIPYKDVDDGELTTEQIREKYAPVCIGPTWRRDVAGGWLLPERTLGWEIAGWCAEYLNSPSGDGPWVFTLEQLRFVLWWYAIDEHGEFVYRTGVMQRLKGHGKDPLAAALCLVELVGPSRFSHFDPLTSEPVGKAHPAAFVQIAAVNQEQTQNTTTMFAMLMTDRFIAEYRVQAGKELIYAMGGRVRLKAVTSSPRALEGGRSTFVILNETHHWIRSNNGVQMFETIDGNATKMDGRYLAITNAYMPGEDSVAERMREAWVKISEGRSVDVGFMYDSLEAAEHTPLDPRILPTVIEMIRGDSVWLKIEAIMKSILSTTMSPERSRRMWLNQVVAGEDGLYGPGDWKALEVDDQLRPGEEICLGFDGGKTDDATALVAIRVRDGFVQSLGIWEKPDGPAADDWQVDRVAVDSAVHDAFKVYRVQGFFADVALWESYIDSWSRDYGDQLGIRAGALSAVGRDMRGDKKNLTLAHEALMGAVLNGAIKHNGDPILTRHTLNARRATNNYGISFRKESRESPKKVDAYAAMFLAFTARREFLERGKTKRKRTGVGYFL